MVAEQDLHDRKNPWRCSIDHSHRELTSGHELLHQRKLTVGHDDSFDRLGKLLLRCHY